MNDPTDYQLTIKVDDIQFDPEDEFTQGMQNQNVSYFAYHDSKLIGIMVPSRGQQTINFTFRKQYLNDENSVIRIIAKETSAALEQGVEVEDND